MEVRSSAEHAEHIQAGASGPWQEYNGTARHAHDAMRDLRYISGSTHQQHTHGIYARTALHCDGKPVYLQAVSSL